MNLFLRFERILHHPSILVLIIFLIISQFFTNAVASSPHLPLQLNLKTAIELARKNNPLSLSSGLSIQNAKLQIEGIRARYVFPRIDLEAYTGLVNDARGDATSSPDDIDDYSHVGPFYNVNINAVQPLFTFGKYTAAINAVRQQVKVEKGTDQRIKDRLAYDVARAFWGIIASREAAALGREIDDNYNQLIVKANEYLEKAEAGVDDSHLLEIKVLYYGIQKAFFESINIGDEALVYLKSLLNLTNDQRLDINCEKIPTQSDDSLQLSLLLKLAKQSRSDLKAINAGLQALEEKIKLARRKVYPDLFVAASGGTGRASGREKQTNPFIVDKYNYDRIGAVLGAKWDLNFYDKRVQFQKVKIEYKKLLKRKQLVLIDVESDVRKSYARVKKYRHLMSAAQSSLKAAKSWVRLENDNFDLAIGEAKRLVDAYKGYYQLARDQIENRFTYVVSLASLAYAVGDMELYVRWIEDGIVRMP